jgi:hypothetical protein
MTDNNKNPQRREVRCCAKDVNGKMVQSNVLEGSAIFQAFKDWAEHATDEEFNNVMGKDWEGKA